MPLQPGVFAHRVSSHSNSLPKYRCGFSVLALISRYKREMTARVPLPGKTLCFSHLCVLSPDAEFACRKYLTSDQSNVSRQKLQEENLQAPHTPSWLAGAEAKFLTRQKVEGTRMCQKKNTKSS